MTYHTIDDLSKEGRCRHTWQYPRKMPSGGYANNHICYLKKGHKGPHRCDCGASTKGGK
jgi:hypothetical protein